MNQSLIFAPVLIPVASAVLLLVAGVERLGAQRAVSAAACAAQLAVALALAVRTAAGDPLVYTLGDWPAPFGIVLVADRLSAGMLLLTQAVAIPALLYAAAGWDARGRRFHALLQFQLMGLNGAFLTGDLFNLFVFFEVLLIASYCLLLHGHGRDRVRATLHYAVINLTGSALFLIAVALLYGATGTLNMADMMDKAATAAPADVPLIASGALLLLVVFGLKAAAFPLYLWLPGAYAAAAAPVAALFAIMTKVGVYAIVRVHAGIFGAGAGPLAGIAEAWLLPAALASAALGALGALTARRLSTAVAYLTVGSVGTLLVAVALPGGTGIGAALYYLPHSTLVTAALFLLVELFASQRGSTGDRIEHGPRPGHAGLLGTMLLCAAVASAGLPPLSGFLGKAMILREAQAAGVAGWVWSVVLLAGMVTLLAWVRAGSALVWNCDAPVAPPARSPAIAVAAAGVLLCGPLLLAVLAGPARGWADATAAQLADRRLYQDRVLGPDTSTLRPTTRPLPGEAGVR